MSFMVVTLDVSKLSVWLNAGAFCRESKEGYAVRGEVYGSGGSRRWTTAAQIGGRARGGAHRKHGAHVCDARGVEAQRLIERRRALPRVDRRAYDAGRCGPWKWEAAGGRGASSVHRRARLQIGSSMRGAHREHGAHVCDAGGVEAQRLIERRRALPRVERRAYDAGRCGPWKWEAAGDRGGKQRAGEGATADWGAGHAERSAH